MQGVLRQDLRRNLLPRIDPAAAAATVASSCLQRIPSEVRAG